MKRLIGLAVFFIMLLASISYAATAMPVGTAADILEGGIDVTDSFYVTFYDQAVGACVDGTYDTYSATNQVGTATGYALHSSGSYTTSTSGSVAFIQSESFSAVTSLVMTISSATFTGADCLVIYHDTNASGGANTGDVALYQSDITEISPSAEDVNITFPADDSSNALIRITVP